MSLVPTSTEYHYIRQQSGVSTIHYPVYGTEYGVLNPKDPKLNICISGLVSLLGHKIVI